MITRSPPWCLTHTPRLLHAHTLAFLSQPSFTHHLSPHLHSIHILPHLSLSPSPTNSHLHHNMPFRHTSHLLLRLHSGRQVILLTKQYRLATASCTPHSFKPQSIPTHPPASADHLMSPSCPQQTTEATRLQSIAMQSMCHCRHTPHHPPLMRWSR